MKTIAILSDTHGMLRPEVIEKLHGCDLILHGGDISVQSGNGETEFSFTIPVAPKPTNTSSNVPELTQN